MISIAGTSEVTGLAFAPDGQCLAAACDRSVVRVFDLATTQQTLKLATPFQIITALRYSPDGRHIAVGGVTTPGGPVQWWRLDQPDRPLRSDPHDLRCKGVVFAPDNQHLYSLSYSAMFRHRLSDASIDRRHLENGIHACAVDSQGCPMVLFDSGAIVRFEPDLSRPYRVVTVPPPIGLSGDLHEIAVLPDRGGIAAACGSHLAIWDGPSVKTPRIREADNARWLKLAVAPNCSQLLVAGPGGTVGIWDTATLRLLTELDWQIGDILSLAISADGLMAAAGGLNRIVVWDMEQ
jgi:WD40 repeat protein